MAGVTVEEREQMSGWDRRQAVMAVANMVESLLRGSGPARLFPQPAWGVAWAQGHLQPPGQGLRPHRGVP